ncbi:MAG: hypothetical protein ACLQVI_21690 [Polyangiaceae bacterium]
MALACGSQGNAAQTHGSDPVLSSSTSSPLSVATTIGTRVGHRRPSTKLDLSALDLPQKLEPAAQSYFWAQQSPAANPGGRDSEPMAYDVASGNIVLFSGEECGTTCAWAPADTWTFNGTTWTKQTPSTAPTARFGHGMAYDSTRNVVVLYGGIPSAGLDDSDTWEWNGSSWTKMSPATNPGTRDSFAMAYDSTRGVTVLFGGETCTTVTNCDNWVYENLNDTWEWNGTNWTKMSPSTSPAARAGTRMVFDSGNQVSWLFGGTTCVLGGCSTNTEYGDTWKWNGTTWAQQTPATSPTARDSFGMAFDTLRGTTVLFGGYGSSGDTWEWNGTTWTQTTPTTSPVYRYDAPMAFDNALGKVVLFGGSTGATDLADTWEYYAHGSTCTAASQCDTGFCVDGVCCDTSSCGTCQSCNAATPGTCAAVTNAPDPPSCTGTQTCSATGVCLSVVGQPCPGGNGDCANGSCVDGFCCSSACANACDVCAQSLGATANGTCSPAAAGYTGDPSCAGGYVCNGTSPTCPASCSADADCASGYFCGASGTCLAQKTLGGTCNPTAGADCLQGQCRECASGNCVDGVCCNSSCSGSCDVCSAALGASADGTCSTAPQGYAGSPTCSPYVCSGSSASCPSSCGSTTDCSSGAFCSGGTCQGTETPGESCGSNGACVSGFCVDGVCCDSACTGECEACDVAGSTGTCTPVVGSPHGSRPACPVPPATEPCQAAQCDGNTRTSCTGYVGSSVTCVQASCTNGVETLSSSCDGMGNCPTAATVQCAPYVCSGTTCETQCASDSDCVSGQRCDTATGTCVAGVTCDGANTITGANGQTTDCSPYTCNPAGCLTSCQSVLDCVSPAVCNSQSQCVLPSNGDTGQSAGSCAVSPRGIVAARGRGAPSTPSGAAGFALLAFTAWLRRRRREGHESASSPR